jgi:hypothetical protein
MYLGGKQRTEEGEVRKEGQRSKVGWRSRKSEKADDFEKEVRLKPQNSELRTQNSELKKENRASL